MEKISICMPTFNRGGTIKRAIESVLNQTYKNIIVYVCDNASSDNTQSVVKEIKDSRVQYLHFDEYLDVNYSFVRALKQADSEYICLFHSDDWYYPDIVEKQLALLKKDSVGAVFSGMNKCDTESDITKVRINNDESYDVYNYSSYLNHALSIPGPGMNCPTFMTKKSVLQECGIFDNPRNMISDMSFWLKIVRKYEIVNYHRNCMNYYISETQLSKKIFSGGHSVVSPSYILLDSEIKNHENIRSVISSRILNHYYFCRFKEIIKVNKYRKQRDLKPFSILYFAIQRNAFTIEKLASNEETYLALLYKKDR